MNDLEQLDLEIIPRYKVDFDKLASARTEDEFLRVSFGLLKEAAPMVLMVANTLDPEHLDGFTRNEATLVGHLIRMTKLMRAVIAGIADGHGGDQQSQLVRQFLDSASTLAYILEDTSDTARIDAYVVDSLIAEREFLKDIREEISARGSQKVNIDERIERSIKQAFETAGVSESEIPARRKNGWPSAQDRLRLFGPTAYSAYRTGSGAIHGSWHDIQRNHLEIVDGKFRPYSEPAPDRPQPLLVMARVGVSIAQKYVEHCVPLAVELFQSRFTDLLDQLERAASLHEEFLAREFDSRIDD
jgi:hypothetical protein